MTNEQQQSILLKCWSLKLFERIGRTLQTLAPFRRCLSSQCIQVKCHWVPRQSVASVNAAFATCRGTARVHLYGTRHFSQHSGYDPGNPAIIPFSSLPETVRITGTRCPHRTVNHQTASKQRRDFCSVTTEWSLFDNHRVVGASPGADTTTTDWSRRDLPHPHVPRRPKANQTHCLSRNRATPRPVPQPAHDSNPGRDFSTVGTQ